MIKPERLKKGDTVAIVSLSGGLLGEKVFLHKLEIAKNRLENDFGLKVKVMPNALKGVEYLYNNPKARAKDLMDAFKDKQVKAIICAIGGEESIRLLPYIDFDVIKNNPKIFTGFSDTTTNHFMMQKAGLVSYYGANIMNNFGEYVEINPYTKKAIIDTLFEPKHKLEIKKCDYVCYDENKVWWGEKFKNTKTPYTQDNTTYELLSGKGKVRGELIGGCADTILELIGTSLWPSLEEFKGKILLLEVSESNVPYYFTWTLRNLAAQGIFNVIKGVVVGKPAKQAHYNEIKEKLIKVVVNECGLKNLPILYNVNVGHAQPIGVFPLGLSYEIDCKNKTLTLLESATK